MANLDQVIDQIKFHLEQLKPKNRHHDFEHLCRHLARARICSNILPATGPVSAGGDQGRDFETFRTYLSSSSIADSTFIGLASQKPIAFACSLEKKEKICGKIKSDVKTIMASGSAIEAVHYFASADVEVSRRHKLQAWAQQTFSLELEIYDGHAISELLADRDVFWIAESYLRVPREIYPRSAGDDGGKWYQETLSKWKDSVPSPNSFAEFSEIKMAARHALYTNEVRQDLLFWVRLMETFVQNSKLPALRRRAIYESAVLSLRGLGTLAGHEDKLREYFSQASEDDDPTNFEDFAVLSNYCIIAIQQHKCELTVQELGQWQETLIQRIENRIRTSNPPNAQASLLYVRGYLCSTRSDPLDPTRSQIKKAIDWWLKLATVAEEAPMFPLERFADHLTEFIELFGKFGIPDNFFELTEKIDALLAKRKGGFATAEKNGDRAVEFYRQNQFLAAIESLHRSKVDWYAAETLQSSLRAMMLMTRCYLSLGLVFAAKYYALAVAFIGFNNPQSEVKHFISVGLLRVALCDYMLGAACGFLNITQTGLRLHPVFSENAGDLSKSDELQSIVFHLVTLKAISERIYPQFNKLLDRKIAEWGLPKEWIAEILPIARQNWQPMTDREIELCFGEEMFGTPFADLGGERDVRWSALGITWKVSWRNDYETTKEAEQFLAVLQVFLAEFASFDLCLLKTGVEVTIDISDESELKIERAPSNKSGIWRIALPRSKAGKAERVGEAHLQVLSAASSILFEASLLPDNSYWNTLETQFCRGLPTRIFVAQPYEKLYREFIGKNEFDNLDRTSFDNFVLKHPVQIYEPKELRWNDKPGPGYNLEEAKAVLRNRYTNVLPSIRFTLRRLKADAKVMGTIKRLRDNGWLDWHILFAISTITVNHRTYQRHEAHQSLEAFMKVWQEVGIENENWEPVPLTLFSEDDLLFGLRTTMPSTLKGLGLECHQLTPDIEAIDHFLRIRYRYWSDDIEHNDPFSV